MTTREQIAFRRRRVLLAPSAGAPAPRLGAAVVLELRNAGLVLDNPEMLTSECAGRVAVWATWSREERGEKGTYTPLFRGFPEQLPDTDDAALRFGVALARLAARSLRDGAVDGSDLRDALDFSGIGWWPASSVPQDTDAVKLDREFERTLPGDSLRQLTVVTLVPDLRDELKAFVLQALASPGSLRADVRDDLDLVLDDFLGELPALEAVPFLETRVLLLRRVFEREPAALATTAPGPDDLLRLFADLTGTDVSLGTTMRFPKLTRAQRRAVVRALEASPRLPDVFRRRGLWLAIARGLHLREFDAPRVHEVFARLRENRRDETSLPSRTEKLLAEGQVGSAARLLRREAPGLLVRQLRRLVAMAESASSGEAFGSTADAGADGSAVADPVGEVLRALADVAGQVPPRVLWAAHGQIADNGATYPRLAITKAGGALRVPGPAGHLAVTEGVRNQVLATLEGALTAHQVARETESEVKLHDARVWIDPALEKVLLPDQLRSTAPGLVQVERGSRLALGEAPVLRLFVHWREPKGNASDLDLSLMALNETFELVSQVSWTNLGDGTMTHSGDLTSAPEGAQEFIDVRLEAAREQEGWRYLVPAVYRYAGPSFGDLPEAVAGWMLREQTSSDRRTYDPATVVSAFALNGRRVQALPMMVDLVSGEVVHLDLYTGHGYQNRVETSEVATAELVAGSVARAMFKPSVAAVVRHAVAARGGVLTGDRAEATVTVGLDGDSTFDVRDPAALLAEVL